MGLLGTVLALAIVLILATVQMSGGGGTQGIIGDSQSSPVPVTVRSHDPSTKSIVLITGTGDILVYYNDKTKLGCATTCKFSNITYKTKILDAKFDNKTLMLSELVIDK